MARTHPLKALLQQAAVIDQHRQQFPCPAILPALVGVGTTAGREIGRTA
jgi:hypothetical protein